MGNILICLMTIKMSNKNINHDNKVDAAMDFPEDISPLAHIRIVLMETSHPGNIGSTARAMKTMGLSQLVLVNPRYYPDPRATTLASNAEDILENAQVVDSLTAAVSDCGLVIGTSSDVREIQMPGLTPRSAAPLLYQTAQACPVAVVFGTERSGLTSEALLRCNYHLKIPTNNAYSSLNLAQAVQIIAYELKMTSLEEPAFIIKEKDRRATFAEVDYFFEHLEKILKLIGFLNPTYPKKIMPRLKRLFNRVQLEHMELQLLRGILTKMDESVRERNLS